MVTATVTERLMATMRIEEAIYGVDGRARPRTSRKGAMMNENTQAEPQSSWGAILLIYAIGVLGATSISQVVPIVGDLGKAFHLSRPQGGWVISTPSAVVAVGALLFGWFVDKFGDKPMLLSGCAVLVLGDLGVT